MYERIRERLSNGRVLVSGCCDVDTNGRAILISKQLNLASLRFRMLLKEVGLLTGS